MDTENRLAVVRSSWGPGQGGRHKMVKGVTKHKLLGISHRDVVYSIVNIANTALYI